MKKKKSLERLGSRFDLLEDRISEFLNRSIEIMLSEEKTGKRIKKNEQSQRNVKKLLNTPAYV